MKEPDANKKGELFEEFVRVFFRQIDGLDVEEVPLNLRWTDLDVVIVNQNSKLKDIAGSIIVVQCKNYSTPISWKIIAETLVQAVVYGNKCKTAILATTSHITDNAKAVIDIVRTRLGVDIIVIEDRDWERFFSNQDLSEEQFIYDLFRRFPERIYTRSG